MMTRETKAGLVVSCSFLCLVGIVLISRLREPDGLAVDDGAAGSQVEPPGEPEPADQLTEEKPTDDKDSKGEPKVNEHRFARSNGIQPTFFSQEISDKARPVPNTALTSSQPDATTKKTTGPTVPPPTSRDTAGGVIEEVPLVVDQKQEKKVGVKAASPIAAQGGSANAHSNAEEDDDPIKRFLRKQKPPAAQASTSNNPNVADRKNPVPGASTSTAPAATSAAATIALPIRGGASTKNGSSSPAPLPEQQRLLGKDTAGNKKDANSDPTASSGGSLKTLGRVLPPPEPPALDAIPKNETVLPGRNPSEGQKSLVNGKDERNPEPGSKPDNKMAGQPTMQPAPDFSGLTGNKDSTSRPEPRLSELGKQPLPAPQTPPPSTPQSLARGSDSASRIRIGATDGMPPSGTSAQDGKTGSNSDTIQLRPLPAPALGSDNREPPTASGIRLISPSPLSTPANGSGQVAANSTASSGSRDKSRGDSRPSIGSSVPSVGTPTRTSPPAASVRSSDPQVESYDEETFACRANETFRSISETYYQSDRYERALALFNRNHPLAAQGVRQDPPNLSKGQAVYLPPARILEKYYGTVIPDPAQDTSAGSRERPAAALRPVVAEARASERDATDNKRTYRVSASGEMLWEIARRTLGDGARWAEISKLNPAYDPKDPLPAGTELRLPPDAPVPAQRIP
jgi:hypothetical protein